MSMLIEFGLKKKKMQLETKKMFVTPPCSATFYFTNMTVRVLTVVGFSFSIRKTAFDDNGGRAERYRFPGGARPSVGNNRCMLRCWKSRQMLADRERAGFHGSPDARSTTPGRPFDLIVGAQLITQLFT